MAVIPSSPSVLPSAWAASGDKTAIPSSAQASGRASYAEGFSPKTSMPESAGGVPPARSDINGVLNELSSNVIWFRQGGQCTWDSTMNFTPPCLVVGSDDRYYSCVAASGPDVSGVGAKDPTVSTNTAYWIKIKAGVSDSTTTADTLSTARTITVNLASTSGASFDGSSNVTPGVSGTLPVTRGGTGVTTIDALKTSLGITGGGGNTVTSGTITTTWVGTSVPYTQNITVSGVTSASVVDVSVASTATQAQVEAYQALNWTDGGVSTNTITLNAWGEKNTIEIPITIVVRG